MSNIKAALSSSARIWRDLVQDLSPYAVVAMVSGGNDSAACFFAAKEIGIKIDYIMHINTRTGIKETTEFVRDTYGNMGIPYIEADAGNAYENYVLRKGFMGRGETAHLHAYHILKAGPMRKALSKHIRQRKRGRKIVLLNGARKEESGRRMLTKPQPINCDPSQKNNIWVNLIHEWDKETRDIFLQEIKAPINPVAKKMCRSGECLCGTMQHISVKHEASALFPEWKCWIDSLEEKVLKKFPWGWGRDVPKNYDKRQTDMFMPMCVGCNRKQETNQ